MKLYVARVAIKVLLIAYARKFHYAVSFMLVDIAIVIDCVMVSYSKLVYVLNRLNLCQYALHSS